MFCQNCGNKMDSKAVICVKCGVPTSNYNMNNPKEKDTQKKGKGIASMVLGIIAVFYSLAAFSVFDNIENDLQFYSDSEQIGYAIGFVLIQSVFAIIAICLASSERKKVKNGFNTSGFWLSIVAFILVAIQFIGVLSY